MKGNI